MLVLTADYAPGNWSGIGVAVANQARELVELGCEVRVITPHPAACATPADGPVLHPLRRDRFPLHPCSADIVHLHSLSLADLALELCRRYGLPLMYTAHTLVDREIAETDLARHWVGVQTRVFTEAQHVFFVSHAELDQALARLPELRSKSSVLYNSVPRPPADGCGTHQAGHAAGGGTVSQSHPKSLRTSEVSLAEPIHHGAIAFVGRFTCNKGIDIAVQTFRGLIGRGRTENYVIAGGHGDPPAEAMVDRLATDYPKICQTPGWLHRPELFRLYQDATLLIIPSRYEPFGLVALEAMSMGVPVLGAAIGGLAEILLEDSGGLTVHSHDPADWMRACERVLTDSELRRRLSEQGPRFVQSRFNARSQAACLLAVADRLRSESTRNSIVATADVRT